MRRLSILLLAWSGIAAQQAPGPNPVQPDTKTGKGETKAGQADTKAGQTETPPASGKGRITGFVSDTADNRLGGVRITLIQKDPKSYRETRSSSEKDKLGFYDSGELTWGNYEIRFEKSGYGTEVIREVTLGSDSQRVDAMLCRGCCSGAADNGWLGLALVGVFVASIGFWRWHNIMAPNRALLRSRIADIEKRAADAGVIDPRIDDIKTRIGAASRLADFFFWSRGEENSAFTTLHFIEVELIEKLSEDRVNARLATTRSFLARSEDGVAKDFLRRIDQANTPDNPTYTPAIRRELLIEAQYYLYMANDTEYSGMTSWQNKSIWLSVTGLSLIVMLGATVDRNILFVVGAAGGFLSRLMSQLKRPKVPNDYGASWSTLFLSPVLGALSGWFGVLMITMATEKNLLGEELKFANFYEPCAVGTLFAAFLMGFSERLFDGIIKKFEDQIDKKEAAASKPGEAPAGPAPPPGPQLTIKPTSGPAGSTVTANVTNPKPEQVERIELISASGEALAADHFERSGDSITFAVPKSAKLGKYAIRLFAQGQKRDTNEHFEVTEQGGTPVAGEGAPPAATVPPPSPAPPLPTPAPPAPPPAPAGRVPETDYWAGPRQAGPRRTRPVGVVETGSAAVSSGGAGRDTAKLVSIDPVKGPVGTAVAGKLDGATADQIGRVLLVAGTVEEAKITSRSGSNIGFEIPPAAVPGPYKIRLIVLGEGLETGITFTVTA